MIILQKDINNVEGIIVDNYMTMNFVADKFRAIANLFGWNYSRPWITRSPEAVEVCIEDLMRTVLIRLKKGEEDAMCASGGLKVNGYLMDDLEEPWYELEISVELL